MNELGDGIPQPAPSFEDWVEVHTSLPSTSSSWLYLAYDQLNVAFIQDLNSKLSIDGIILIEAFSKGSSRPYHKQKLGLVLSSQRHFALELISQNYRVCYRTTKFSITSALRDLLNEHQFSLHTIDFAERDLRNEFESEFLEHEYESHPHIGWLTPLDWFTESLGDKPPFRMDQFYRYVRKSTGWLMEGNAPEGGKYSFDQENRLSWKGTPLPLPSPTFGSDWIDDGVTRLVNSNFGEHPGHINLVNVPTSQQDIALAMTYALSCLEFFGPYEDAMSSKHRSLFHSKLASCLNIHRVMPIDVVNNVLRLAIPLQSKEGFLRQLIWREYVHHVHVVTHGFEAIKIRHHLMNNRARWGTQEEHVLSHPNFLEQFNPLPQSFWGQKTGLYCFDHVVTTVLEDGWTHHIPRLMVLSNIAQLADVNPKELSDWFHASFIDAFDWVVEPNVLGMGTSALGDTMMTKPYISGSAYIHRMSDFCQHCELHPKKSCPLTSAYWQFFERHGHRFDGNHRLAMTLSASKKRTEEQKRLDVLGFEFLKARLEHGIQAEQTKLDFS